MNKLEKAISLTMSDEVYINKMYGSYDSSKSMKDIALMDDMPALQNQELIDKKIVFQGSEQEELIHKLRDIRTLLNKTKNKNLVMIASVEKNSGTSFFARNLAAISSFDSSRTSLLVDCNVDNQNVAKIFNLQDSLGLIDYIYDSKIDEADIINSVGIMRYRCITAGILKSESEEYFMHPRFRSLLTGLKNRYNDRNIYIDSPPLLESSNARILLELCDQVILVSPFGKLSSKKLENASKLIPKEKFSGIVINDFI